MDAAGVRAAMRSFRRAWELQHADDAHAESGESGESREGGESGERGESREGESGARAQAEAYARAHVAMSTAGMGGAPNEGAMRGARTVEELSVRVPLTSGADAGAGSSGTVRAQSLWRRHGLVVFPAVLDAATVAQLATHVTAAVAHSAVDRSANIRAPSNRTLRALEVDSAAAAIRSVGAALAPFLGTALLDPTLLLLELAAYRVAPGAAAQAWHRDDGVLDTRLASVQIAVSDTTAEQGALEVEPGSHTHDGAPSDEATRVALAVPAGSVVVYSPNLVHRGAAHTAAHERLAVTLNLMSVNGLVPNGIPLAVLPQDAGRWRLIDGGRSLVRSE